MSSTTPSCATVVDNQGRSIKVSQKHIKSKTKQQAYFHASYDRIVTSPRNACPGHSPLSCATTPELIVVSQQSKVPLISPFSHYQIRGRQRLSASPYPAARTGNQSRDSLRCTAAPAKTRYTHPNPSIPQLCDVDLLKKQPTKSL